MDMAHAMVSSLGFIPRPQLKYTLFNVNIHAKLQLSNHLNSIVILHGPSVNTHLGVSQPHNQT